MSVMDITFQKQKAIRQHSLQAGEFAERYRRLPMDPYRDCFSYSRHRLQRALERQLPEPKGGSRLLDVGCGTGHHLAWLRERGFDVTGVDGSAEMLRQARVANPHVELRLGDVEALPFPDASFDVVLCVEVLRYLPDPTSCLRELARVLRPGGICLTTAAPQFSLNGYWLINRLTQTFALRGLVRLKQFFTTASCLRRQFIEAGFLRPAVCGVYFGPVNWVERLLPGWVSRFLQAWERSDQWLAESEELCDLSNMFLVRAASAGRRQP